MNAARDERDDLPAPPELPSAIPEHAVGSSSGGGGSGGSVVGGEEASPPQAQIAGLNLAAAAAVSEAVELQHSPSGIAPS